VNGNAGHEWEGEGMWQVDSAESWNERRNLRRSLRCVRLNVRSMSMTRWQGQGGVGSSSGE